MEAESDPAKLPEEARAKVDIASFTARTGLLLYIAKKSPVETRTGVCCNRPPLR